MAIYDGFVSLGEDEVHVILGVDENKVTLSSNGSEIGTWRSDEISILYLGEGTYTITAENETLEFVPKDQDLFAIRFGEISDDRPAVSENGFGRHASVTPKRPAQEGDEAAHQEAAAPRPVTKVAFYVLAGITAFLGLWAIVSMIIG